MKELADCNETSFGKTFVPDKRMIKIWCLINKLRELQHIETVHFASAYKERFSAYGSTYRNIYVKLTPFKLALFEILVKLNLG